MGCFIGTAFVGIVEWWIRKGMPYPPHVMANQVGMFLPLDSDLEGYYAHPTPCPTMIRLVRA